MRKLVVPAFVSLDGVMQAPGGPQEDTSGGFIHGGWVWPFSDDSDDAMGGVFQQPFDLVLGRRTYDIFASYWPNVAPDAPHRDIADLFNGATKHVATHHPATLAWPNSRALGTDVIAALRTLKQDDGPHLLTQGSSELVHALLATDLVDTLILLVYPVLLGRGKRLFDERAQAAAFRLAQTTASAKGVLISRYERNGDVQSGDFSAG